jgi:hypothetical protein
MPCPFHRACIPKRMSFGVQKLLPLEDARVQLDEQDGPSRELRLRDRVRRDASGKAPAVEDGLDDAGGDGGAVEGGHVEGDVDRLGQDGVVVVDHVLVGVLGRLLERVGGFGEEVLEEGRVDVLQQRKQSDDTLGAWRRPGR